MLLDNCLFQRVWYWIIQSFLLQFLCFRDTRQCSVNGVIVMLSYILEFYTTISVVCKMAILHINYFSHKKYLLIFCKLHLITHSVVVMHAALDMKKVSSSVEFCSPYKLRSHSADCRVTSSANESKKPLASFILFLVSSPLLVEPLLWKHTVWFFRKYDE